MNSSAQSAARSRLVGATDAIEKIRSLVLLGDIPEDEILIEVGKGALRLEDRWRDEVIANGTNNSDRIWIVLTGELGLASFDPEILNEELQFVNNTTAEDRRRKIRPQGPLMRLANKTHATFRPGHLLNSRVLISDPDKLAIYTTAPSELLSFEATLVANWASSHSEFARRMGNAVELTRQRLKPSSEIGDELLDFYVRQGFSVATRIRVLRVDRCIDCKQCEVACAHRYGAPRLKIHETRLGLVDFVTTCRSCNDQRCIDPCNFDSIEFDPQTGEIHINEESCTGCASCATACPYGSIRMVRLDDENNNKFKARLEHEGALAHGRGTLRREPAEQIAQKCNHCSGYGDQACITHCPTGALVELTPDQLFGDQDDMAAAQLGEGYPRGIAARKLKPFSPDPFEDGVRVRRVGVAKTKRRYLGAWLLWSIAVLTLVAAAVEIFLRRALPLESFQYRTLLAEGLPPDIAAFNVDYLSGSPLSLWLGYIGGTLMLASLLYPARKRFPILYRWSSGKAWFDIHVLGGALGPMFIVLHSAFNLVNWVAIAFWSVLVVFGSGIVGRFLYTQLPQRFSGQDIEFIRHRAAIETMATSYPRAAAVARNESGRYRAEAVSSFLAAVTWLAIDDFTRPFRYLAFHKTLAATGAPANVCRELRYHTARIVRTRRRRALASRFEGFFRAWLRVHVLFTIIATLVSVAHIVIAVWYLI